MKEIHEKYVQYCDMPDHIAEKIDDSMFTNGVYRFIYFNWVLGLKEWCTAQGFPENAERVLVYFDW